MPSRETPRVSLLTPAGLGAIAVVRLEGLGAGDLLKHFFHPRRGAAAPLEPNRIVGGELRDRDQLLDDVLVVPAAGCVEPESYDICAHGGLRVLERIVMGFVDAGARFVGRGEMTSATWPVANVIEREVWSALVRTRTRRTVRFLLRQRNALPDELRRLGWLAVSDREAAVAGLQALLARWRGCRFLLDGATVAISGPPNAGKSTLANRLIGADRSIVSPHPGTTLDWVAQETAISGVPVTLIDCPGYGRPGGVLDELAIARARARSLAADLHLRVFDGSQPPPEFVEDFAGIPALLVLNKCDLGSVWTPSQIEVQRCQSAIDISAIRGTGVDPLIGEIVRMMGVDWVDETVIGLFTDRQARLASELVGPNGGRGTLESVLLELIGEST